MPPTLRDNPMTTLAGTEGRAYSPTPAGERDKDDRGSGAAMKLDRYATLRGYADWQRQRGLSPVSIRNGRIWLTACLGYLAEHGVDWDRASARHINAWLDSRPLQARTRANYLRQVGKFYKWAVQVEHLTSFNPVNEIEAPKVPRSLPRPIVTEELEEAIRWALPRIRLMLCLACYAGLRAKEVASIRCEDINRSADTIFVRYGKGGKERYVVLHEEIIAALEGYNGQLPTKGWLFPSPVTGGHLNPRTVSNLVNAHLHDCGYDATCHQLRHWFGTYFYDESGGDILLTKELMGHESIETTMGYARANMSKAHGIVSRLTVNGGKGRRNERDLGRADHPPMPNS